MTLKTVIADDEPLARAHLRSLLEGDSGVVVAGECGDGASAVAASKEGYQQREVRNVPIHGDTRFDIQLVRR